MLGWESLIDYMLRILQIYRKYNANLLFVTMNDVKRKVQTVTFEKKVL